MKICPNCGHSNEEEAGYCLRCGEALPENEVLAVAEAKEEAAPFLPVSLPVIENDTPYNQEMLRTYYRFLKVGAILLFIVGIFFLAFSSYPVTQGELPEIELLLCGAFVLLCGGIYLWQFYKMTKQNTTVTQTSRQLYLFKEDGLHAVFSDNGEKLGENFLSYDKISKVTMTKRYLLIRFGSSAFIVDRATFTQGSTEEAIALLREKCPPKTVKIRNV